MSQACKFDSKKCKKVVACFDLDCFYAQVAEKLDPQLKGKPVAIKQKYIIVTCNYEARKRGVGKLETIENAKTKCPELVLVDGSDLRPFRTASEQINSVWGSFGCPVERQGMDESFLDLTQLVERRIEDGDKPNNFLGHVYPTSAKIETRLDLRFAVASVIAQEIRDALFEQLGYQCCGGISCSKLTSKFAVEMHKPNQQTVLLPQEIPAFIRTQPVSRVRGIGRKLSQQLYMSVMEESCGGCDVERKDLLCKHIQRLPWGYLLRGVGSASQAQFVYEAVRGIDKTKVKPSGRLKSISQDETRLPHPTTVEAAMIRLGELCERILPFVNERVGDSGEFPATVRVAISDKGDLTKAKYSQRSRGSRQCKADPGAFKDRDALFNITRGLLLSMINHSRPFTLLRMNLCVTDFNSSSSRTDSKNISSFFGKANALASKSTTPVVIILDEEGASSSKRPRCQESSALVLENGIDPDTLAELPPSIQHDILQSLEAKKKPKKGSIVSYFTKKG
mmetsp:Transcript_27142/g.43597  ORF Transcript_27142/g.43597 Transcript_27142/m.43597 type:complete len:508 (-) Transcript_27142:1793-3316(-)